MRLRNHIAFLFTTNKLLGFNLAVSSANLGLRDKPLTVDAARRLTDQTEEGRSFLFERDIFSPDKNRNVLITESVVDKLDMLKVKRTVDDNRNFDWSVFDHISDRKRTFILSNDELIRMYIDNGYMVFVFIKRDARNVDGIAGNDHLTYTRFWIHKPTQRYSSNMNTAHVKKIDEYVYKILCFIYLSDNEEIILRPGDKHGTKKTGKVINEFATPLLILNSRWNITTIRTEGFPVSAHFRLQPFGEGRSMTKMILIDAFEKHGYIRRAGNELSDENQT